MIDIDEDARSYLAAVGAMAIAIITINGIPLRVNITRDPMRTLGYIQRSMIKTSIAWLSWFDDSKKGAGNFALEIDHHQAKIVYAQSDDGVRRAQPLDQVIDAVMEIAAQHEIILTPHDVAMARARLYAQRLEAALHAFQESGQLTAFNHAYRIYREQQRLRGESALPYWAAKERLRQVIIHWLVQHRRPDPGAMLLEIHQRFPWFKTYGRIRLASSRRPSSIGKI